ncbi:MAG: Ig-like domain-containing protein, partial [Patescibacteria group bacterium]
MNISNFFQDKSLRALLVGSLAITLILLVDINTHDISKQELQVSGALNGVAAANLIDATGGAQLAAAGITTLPDPDGLTAVALSQNSIKIGWSYPTGVSIRGFSIERTRDVSCATGFTYLTAVRKGTYTYTNTGLLANTFYCYRVQAYQKVASSYVYSAYSNMAGATTQNMAGSLMIKRVGSDDTVQTAPLGTAAKVDQGVAIIDNPAYFSPVSVGSHIAYASDVAGFEKLVGTCSFAQGTTECSVNSFSVVPTQSCDGVVCAFPIDVSAGVVRKVVFKYIDIISPQNASITSPISQTYTTAQTVSIIATATDNVGVTKMEFYDNSVLKGIDVTPADGFIYRWIVSDIDNGTHSWTVKAYDAAGNMSALSPDVILAVNMSTIPPLTASCSVSPTTILVGGSATWSASPSGGTGFYTYAWSGTDSLTGSIQSVSKTYTLTGIKSASVTVTSGTEIITQTCSNSLTVNAPAFDFSLSNGGARSVVQGSSVTNTVTATLLAGATQAVSFTASGLPVGATATFSPASCNPTCTTTLTVSTLSTTPTGASTITITGTGGVTRTTSFSLTVNAPAFDFSLSNGGA